MPYSANIMHAMQQIHMLGIAPKDFAEGNVLVNESGQYMIIDFENFQRGHKCQWSYNLSARSDGPRYEESKRLAVECSSLWQDATQSRFWERGALNTSLLWTGFS